MLLFLLALVVAVVGVGAFAHYNPGTMDVTVRTFRFDGIPIWEVVAVAAGVPLLLFLVHAIYAGVRIRLLRRANDRLAAASGRAVAADPAAAQSSAPRSWSPSGD